MNRLENKTLGRELSKHRVQDKRMGTGNERVHLGSGKMGRYLAIVAH